ncbi:MAG: hypothetical protein H6883_05580 [Rhodobiaceae bacterium]|nr:hypothetical protein [Rhodobiaceae bacterium]
MLGFLNKLAAKEHIKLMYQNYRAATFLHGFEPELAQIALRQVESLQLIWAPGKVFPAEVAKSLMNTNRALRRAYDGRRYMGLKSFDQEFQPILGWKDYYKSFDLG